MDNRRGEIKMSTYEAWAGQVIEKIRRKMARVSEKNQDKIPYTTDEAGNYDDRSDSSKAGILTTD